MTSPEFRAHVDGDPPILHVHGDVDLMSCEALAEALRSHEVPRPAVVDLGGVSFMDSSGLNVLVSTAVADGGLTVRNPTPIVRRVIIASGLDELLAVEP